MIDTHCHLNQVEAFPDPAAVIARALEVGVNRLGVVGVDLESCKKALELADQFEPVFAILGFHPNYTAKYESSWLGELEQMLVHTKAKALGEIGLDFHWDYSTPEIQEKALRDQLALAESLGKPVVFHCRAAYPSMLTLLEEIRPKVPMLIHCFSGGANDLERAMALDCWYGIDGPITYKKSGDLRGLVQEMPKDRIVIETDSPYLTPEPFRGKPNEPAHVRFVNSALAASLQMSGEECDALTTRNAEVFFRL